MTYKDIYKQGCEILTAAKLDEAWLDARLLLEWVCKTDRNTLLVHGEKEVAMEEESTYFRLIKERAKHVPLQHLTHTQNFMGLDFYVDEHVLIPRQDTEILVEEVLKELHDGMDLLDMCTGSGCILLSLLHYSNNCRGVAVDFSEAALAVAKRNQKLLLPDADVTFVWSDLFAEVSGKFDFIVSNPPYVTKEEYKTLMPEVADYEPRMALVAEQNGLAFYERITKECKPHLNSGGRLYYEIGAAQAEAVSAILKREGFWDIHVVKDYAGLDRVVYGSYSI